MCFLLLATGGLGPDGPSARAGSTAGRTYDSSTSLPPGAALPDERACAAAVSRSVWEPRPDNDRANRTVPPGPVPSRSWGNAEADGLRDRVTGRFTGTTDEIIRWASCKWGFGADVTRAQAVRESDWHQSARGDGGISYGLLQIKSTVWTGTHPWSERSTGYNVDWSLGMRRACYDGLIYDGVGRGDLWGCVGVHYSGSWMDAGAREYTAAVRQAVADRTWERWPSAAGGRAPPPDP